MGKRTETDTVETQTIKLFHELLKKADVTEKELTDLMIRSFIKDNLYLLSADEKKKYTKLIF